MVASDVGVTELSHPGGNFIITNLHVIDSRPDSLDSGSCMNTSNGMRRCCNVEQISGFNLSVDFVFGVTGPSQGNTHSASLLGCHVSLSQYIVDTQQRVSAGQSTSPTSAEITQSEHSALSSGNSPNINIERLSAKACAYDK